MVRPLSKVSHFITATHEVRKHQSYWIKLIMHLEYFIFIGFIPWLAAGKYTSI